MAWMSTAPIYGAETPEWSFLSGLGVLLSVFRIRIRENTNFHFDTTFNRDGASVGTLGQKVHTAAPQVTRRLQYMQTSQSQGQSRDFLVPCSC